MTTELRQLEIKKKELTDIYRPVKREYIREYRQTCIKEAEKNTDLSECWVLIQLLAGIRELETVHPRVKFCTPLSQRRSLSGHASLSKEIKENKDENATPKKLLKQRPVSLSADSIKSGKSSSELVPVKSTMHEQENTDSLQNAQNAKQT